MEYLNTALIVLYDADKRLLLQQRTMDTTRLPGYWAFFGGNISEGETPFEAVHRETLEELDYNLKSPEFIFEQDFKLGETDGHMRVYIDAFLGDKSTLKLREGQDWGWYNQEETRPLKMVDHDRVVIDKIVRHFEGINKNDKII